MHRARSAKIDGNSRANVHRVTVTIENPFFFRAKFTKNKVPTCTCQSLIAPIALHGRARLRSLLRFRSFREIQRRKIRWNSSE